MSNIKLFESKQIRSQWDADAEKWYFSIVNIIGVLTDSPSPRNYWKVLKHRLKKEGNEWVTNCNQLKMQSTDGKFYLTDIADTEQLLRLIQSIPSSKAEPFKQWLAKVGYERIEESQDPEMSIDRAMENYFKLGYSKEWINQRLKSIEVRKELTDEWENRGVKKGQEFTITQLHEKNIHWYRRQSQSPQPFHRSGIVTAVTKNEFGIRCAGRTQLGPIGSVAQLHIF